MEEATDLSSDSRMMTRVFHCQREKERGGADGSAIV